MESKVASAMLLMVMVLGMVADQAHAVSTESFKDCYGLCFLGCMITPDRNIFKCSFKCLKDCINIEQSIPDADIDNACKLGCASSRCTNISTRENPGVEAVEGCVKSCSDECIKH